VSARRAQTFFGRDRYAAFALNETADPDGSWAGGDVYVAARGVSQSVIPSVDGGILRVQGEVAEEADAVAEILFSRSSRRELWDQPNLAMELQSYVVQLIQSGELFIRLRLDRASTEDPYSLLAADWLAPETVLRRRHGNRVVYEQYVSVRAFEDPSYVVEGTPREHLAEFLAEEVLHLQWPLDEPGGSGSPAAAALRAGVKMERQAQLVLLSAQAGAEPEETFLPVARARAGAFAGALEAQQIASARVKDMLFYPGAYEAAAFPWVQDATDFFLAERALQSRVAICRLREYLFSAFNEQVLARWTRLNGWGAVRLELAGDVFSEEDWVQMHSELRQGGLSYEDVLAAIAAESESA
jgi:hypothetical protein